MLRQNSNTTRTNIGARFALGETFITPGAQDALDIAGQTAMQFLRRHISCDWGEVSEDDAQENELSLREGYRLLSAYRTVKGQKIYGTSPKRIAARRRFSCHRSTGGGLNKRAARVSLPPASLTS